MILKNRKAMQNIVFHSSDDKRATLSIDTHDERPESLRIVASFNIDHNVTVFLPKKEVKQLVEQLNFYLGSGKFKS